MLDTIRILIRICLFAANPQDLPAKRQTLTLCVAGTFVVLFAGYKILAPGANPVLLAASHTLLLGVAWIVLLQLSRKITRWYQSASAVYGTSAIMNLISLPIISGSLPMSATSDGAAQPGFSSFVLIALWMWEIGVTARIVRESIEIRMSMAIGISLLMSFVLQFIMINLFGPGN
ncbi:MAG: hypothetical protein ACR2QW_06040 [bacterium]